MKRKSWRCNCKT